MRAPLSLKTGQHAAIDLRRKQNKKYHFIKHSARPANPEWAARVYQYSD